MAATWPLDLPPAVRWGWSRTPRSAVSRTQMDGGNTKARPRFTKSVKTWQVSTTLTKSQMDSFITFFEDGLKNGALPFEWILPRNGQAATFMMLNEPPEQHKEGSQNSIVDVVMLLEQITP